MTLPQLRAPSLARWLLPVVLCALHLAALTAAGEVAASAPASSAGETDQVLVITGTDPYLPAFVAIDAAMRAALVRRHERPVVWLYESIDSVRLGGITGPAFAELLARKYEGVRIDAVVLYT